jgi:hypothetical protein
VPISITLISNIKSPIFSETPYDLNHYQRFQSRNLYIMDSIHLNLMTDLYQFNSCKYFKSLSNARVNLQLYSSHHMMTDKTNPKCHSQSNPIILPSQNIRHSVPFVRNNNVKYHRTIDNWSNATFKSK